MCSSDPMLELDVDDAATVAEGHRIVTSPRWLARNVLAPRSSRQLSSTTMQGFGWSPEQQAIVTVVHREFGEPIAVRFPEVWGPRVVVEATLEDGSVVVKATGDADVSAEARVLTLASDAGVPTPRLLASGTDSALPGGRWIAMSKAPGIQWPIDDAVHTARTVRDIATCFARLHRVRLEGFGPVDPSGRGVFESWQGWLCTSASEDLDTLVAAGLAGNEFRTKAESAFATLAAPIEPGCLVHGDLGAGETFVDPGDGGVTCIVDWGGAIIGDPVYEFARFVAGGPADDPRPSAILPKVIEYYVAETGMDRDRPHRVLPLYHAHNAISNAAWSYREEVPWIDGLLGKADGLLDHVSTGATPTF